VLTDEQMQCIGAEMNLSETAFITLDKGDFVTANSFGLRWFTPATEVDLCGHATLASAAVLFKVLGNINDVITFTSRSGPLMVNRFDETKISLNFPENLPVSVVIVADESLIQDIQLSNTGKLLVRLKDNVQREVLEAMKPQIDRMIESDRTGLVKGVGVFRGSSWHTVAGPYFARELNKTRFYARQCSKRGGDLWVTLDDQRVILTGESAVVLQGTFLL
ncbi:unnamed protein product, partial [Candidula unifasciata]